jgi:DNA/RNA endonuclease G (NUC1)
MSLINRLGTIINLNSCEHLINNGSFLINYSASLGRPIWAAYSLTKQDVLSQKGGRKVFTIDNRLKSRQIYQLDPDSDIFGKYFSRGHLVPAFMMSHQKDKIISGGIHPSPWYRTFQMSNVIPQNNKFNMEKWHKLENVTKNIIARNNFPVHVIVGCHSQDFSKKYFFSGKKFDQETFCENLSNYQTIWIDEKSDCFYHIPNIMYQVVVTPYDILCWIGTNDSRQIVNSVSLDYLEALIGKKLLI